MRSQSLWGPSEPEEGLALLRRWLATPVLMDENTVDRPPLLMDWRWAGNLLTYLRARRIAAIAASTPLVQQPTTKTSPVFGL